MEFDSFHAKGILKCKRHLKRPSSVPVCWRGLWLGCGGITSRAAKDRGGGNHNISNIPTTQASMGCSAKVLKVNCLKKKVHLRSLIDDAIQILGSTDF